MNKLKKNIAVILAVIAMGLSLSSCHREGCPNNFKMDGIYELVQQVLR